MTILEEIWREAWRPPDRRPPWAWAEEHIGSIPYSPLPGRFRSDNSPQIREPLETIVDPKVRLVFIIASIQSSKTSVGEIGLCHIIANLPGPALWLDQTDDDAKDQAESRLHKLFEDCTPVRALFPGDRRPTFVHKTKVGRSIQRFYSPRRKVVLGHNQHCSTFYFSNLGCKDALARLRRNQDPARGATWDVPDDIDDEYLSQMESERRVKKGGKWMWERIGKRGNHGVDLEAMQVCAAFMLKLIGREAASAEISGAETGTERAPVDAPESA